MTLSRPNPGFNSILVRLEGRRFSYGLGFRIRFNSILVRLEACCVNSAISDFCIMGFNSIAGSIRRRVGYDEYHYAVAFQFHTGSIRRTQVLEYPPGHSHFVGFQFHTGSIKRRCRVPTSNALTFVSISYWFD